MPQTRELPWLNKSTPPSGAKVLTDPAVAVLAADAVEASSDTGEVTHNWGKGTYTYSIVKGDAEVHEGATSTWFHCQVRSHQDGVTTHVGSLRFEGTEFTYWAKHSAFVEIYSTQKVPRSLIPRVGVTFGYPRLNGVKFPSKRTIVNYNATGGAMAPASATAKAEGSNIVVELGPIFVRDPKDGVKTLDVKPE